MMIRNKSTSVNYYEMSKKKEICKILVCNIRNVRTSITFIILNIRPWL